MSKRQAKKQNKPKKKASKPSRPKLGILPTVGSAIGSFLGGDVGKSVGRSAGSWLAKVTGLGAYKVRKNTLMMNDVPSFKNGDNYFDVYHREFIADISGTTAFTVTSYPIQPGLSTSFPWLSIVSQGFEEYELMGMLYEYKTTSGTAVGSTNTALGTVVMATNYDPLDPLFSDKRSMEAYEFSTSTVPSLSAIHPVECAPRQTVLTHLYTRHAGATVAGADLRFHDFGNFQIATVGMQAGTTVIGELWVTYHVRFYKPRVHPVIGSVCLCATVKNSPAGSASVATPLGTSGPSYSSGNTLSVIASSPSSGNVNLIVPRAGSYLVLAAIGNNSGFAFSGTMTIGTFGSNIGQGPVTFSTHLGGTSLIAAVTNPLVTVRSITVLADGTTSANQLLVSIPASGGSPTQGDFEIIVMQIPNNLTTTVPTDELESLIDRYLKLKGDEVKENYVVVPTTMRQ